jgi:hypothetical protein
MILREREREREGNLQNARKKSSRQADTICFKEKHSTEKCLNTI